MISKKFIQSFFVFLIINYYSFSQTVTIGNQVWTTENLNVTTFRNGDPIPQAKSNDEWEAAGHNKQPAWCYYNNDPENGAKYGILYNWYAVSDQRGLPPDGFHIPTDAEWDVLVTFLGGAEVAGKKMKSVSGWRSYSATIRSGNGTNSSGFSGLPGVCRPENGDFSWVVPGIGYWWSSTESDSIKVWTRCLDYCNPFVNKGILYKESGCSVRCIKD